MTSASMAIIAILALASIALVFAAIKIGGPKQLFHYFKKNPGILGGVIAFTLLGLVSIYAAKSHSDPQPIDYGPVRAIEPRKEPLVRWFQGGWVYLGLDALAKTSPQCHSGPISDSLTSNGGFEANILESLDSKFQLNAKYTHHSCAFNKDNESYDSLGIVVVYRLW